MGDAYHADLFLLEGLPLQFVGVEPQDMVELETEIHRIYG
jgi:hypothetical protein